MEFPPGWTCEQVAARLEAYLLDRLALAEALALADHLEACAGCGHQLVLRRTVVITRGARG
jgi:hypothetical protein